MGFVQCEMELEGCESPLRAARRGVVHSPALGRSAEERASLLSQWKLFRNQASLAAAVGATTENHFLCRAVEAELNNRFPDWREQV